MVDLALRPGAGGHVKCWERLGRAALGFPADVDLTVFLSGAQATTVEMGANLRFETLPPVFSTRRLAFLLGDIPDHTDLAPWHPALAQRLADGFDVLHTTDAFFAFSRTAAGVARARGVPLVNSVHTATPALTRLFTQRTLDRLFGGGAVARLLIDGLHLPERAERGKIETLLAHQAQCAFALVSREDDRQRAVTVLPQDRVRRLRRGVDHALFSPAKRDRDWVLAEYGIPKAALLVLFVGRLDSSKNVGVLAEAVRRAAARGASLFLLCAGEGSERGCVQAILGEYGACPGQIEPTRLGRVYACADVVAAPSEIEIFGNVVLEALASGVPVVVAERGGMGSVLDPDRTGVIVSGQGPDPWARVLAGLAGDRDRLAGMAAAVRAGAGPLTPSWDEVFAQDLLPVWREAVGRRAGRQVAA